MKVIEGLTEFGLTKQEATIYVTLNVEGALTGYEVSKLTGISRSNTYTALASLTDKGAAYLIEGEKKLYSPVPVLDLCSNRIRRMQKTARAICEEMPEPKDVYQGYITIQGRKNIFDQMVNTILKAEKRIYLSMHKTVLDELEEYLNEAIRRGLKVVIITNTAVKLTGATIYRTDKRMDEIRLIADSREVITGDIRETASTCLYSTKKNLVELLKESLTNEIELIRIRGDIINEENISY